MGNHYTVVACGSGGEAGYIARSSYTRRHCPCIVIIGCRSAAWGGCNGCSSTGTYTWWVHRYTWCSCKAHCAGGRRRYTTCCLMGNHYTCVLYTSDAADERTSVDIGGRRIIKKKI